MFVWSLFTTKKKELIDNNNLLSEEKKAANDIYLVRVVVLCKYLCKTEKIMLGNRRFSS